MSKQTILVVGHGSRVPQAIDQFNDFITRLAERLGQPVLSCFLELADPDMATGLTIAAEDAGPGGQVLVLPLFLGAAGHQKNDVSAAIHWARGQFPEVSFKSSAPLGPHAKLIDLLDLRVQEAFAANPAALPPEESIVLVIGRGSSDPAGNAEIARAAYLLQEKRPYMSVEFAFQAVARPKVPAGLRRCAQLGAKQIVVAPFILFTGKVDEYILQVTRQAQTELGLPALPASYLGVHDLVIDVAEQRVNELLADSVMMSCDLCKYRFPMAGYAHEVGAPQETHHLHGGSAHSHEHHHGHHHHHDDEHEHHHDDHGHHHHHDDEHEHHHHDHEHGHHHHDDEHEHHHDDDHDHDDCCHHHHHDDHVHFRSPRRQFGRQGHSHHH